VNIADQIRSIAAKVDPYVAFVAVAEHALGVGGPPVVVAVDLIKAGIDALAKGASGQSTPDQVVTELHALLARVKAGEAANDAAADAIVAARRAAVAAAQPAPATPAKAPVVASAPDTTKPRGG
jgi:hypothetical protein